MTQNCPLHELIQKQVDELKEAGNKREAKIMARIPWTTFIWIIGLLLAIVLGIQAVIWGELKANRNEIINNRNEIINKIESSDKEDGLKRSETWRRLEDLKTSVIRLEMKIENHLNNHQGKK